MTRPVWVIMWVKGNLHSHTNLSDGDMSPSDVCRLYADAGYDFLSITDHALFVDPSQIDSHGLLLIPGEELTMVPEEDHTVPLHVNGFGLRRTISAERGATRLETIQNCIDAIVADAGIAQINHPNFYYAFDHKVIEQTDGCYLLEVYNGHPLTFEEGDETHVSVEFMWDYLLSQGKLFYGTGVDDGHHYSEINPSRANPFKGWIWADVEELTVQEVLGALWRGDFYASSGVELEDLAVGWSSTYRVAIAKSEGLTYTTQFISNDGEVLHESHALVSSFELPDDDTHTYVRAKVTASDGTCAWTQPLFVK